MMNESNTGHYYCPKCETYLLGNEVESTNRHKECGEPVEWRGWEEPKLPLWVTISIMIALIIFVLFLASHGEEVAGKRKQEKEDKKNIENFSRMSESPEVQDAYNRVKPLNK